MTPDETIEQAWQKWREGEFVGTIAACEAVLAIDPHCMAAYRLRAMAYVGLREFKQALLDFGRFLELRYADAPPFS